VLLIPPLRVWIGRAVLKRILAARNKGTITVRSYRVIRPRELR
jgi:hypothetical protein